MKKRILVSSALSIVFALGLGFAVIQNNNTQPTVVKAATHNQHLDNFDPYTYSGSYYSGINATSLGQGVNGSLRTKLTELIEPDGWYTYGGSGANTLSTQLQYCDEDPTNSANMIYFYSRDSVKKNAASSWNREHVWPKSLSKGNYVESKAGTDILHLRPTYNTVNSTRGSLLMADTGKANPYYYDGMLCGYRGSGKFEPLDSVKGDVAREYMYLWVAYRSIYSSNPLDILDAIESYDTLLKWHMNDKPDVLEGNRNDYSETSKQKNRNPFVDHPEYAWMVFGDSASAAVKQQCMDQYPADGGTSKTMTSISLSGEPNKKEYNIGDYFDPTGLTVTGNYDDGSTRNIPLANCTWSPSPLVANATTVVCNYNGFTAIYTGITVNGNTHEHTFSDEYSYDETYHWHDATCGHDVVSGKEPHSFVTVVTQPTEEEGGYTTHTCSVCGYEYTDNETPPLTLVRIRVTDNKAATGYQIGEELDLTVTATYDNNSTAVVTGYTVEGFNNQKPGEQTITVMYTAGTVTKGNIIQVTVLSNGEEEPEQPNDKEKRGCNGSITALSSITAFSALIGLIFVLKRKK